MKRAVLGVGLVAVALAAGAVALLAMPGRQPEAAAAFGRGTSSPILLIRKFYTAVDNWNFGNAYLLVDPHARPAFRPWASGYFTTVAVSFGALRDPGYRVRRKTGLYTCVAVRLRARHLDGQTSIDGGWYMTRFTRARHWRILLPGSRLIPDGRPRLLRRSACGRHIRL